MVSVVEAVVSALEPWVGRMAADTCVRATALSAGKMSDELGVGDLPSIDASIRRLLGPVAPASAIDSMIAEIHGAVS